MGARFYCSNDTLGPVSEYGLAIVSRAREACEAVGEAAQCLGFNAYWFHQ